MKTLSLSTKKPSPCLLLPSVTRGARWMKYISLIPALKVPHIVGAGISAPRKTATASISRVIIHSVFRCRGQLPRVCGLKPRIILICWYGGSKSGRNPALFYSRPRTPAGRKIITQPIRIFQFAKYTNIITYGTPELGVLPY